MIAGLVNVFNEAAVRLVVHGIDARMSEVEFIVDTGFTEFLSMPSSLIDALGLEFSQTDEMMLSDGTIAEFRSFKGKISWLNEDLEIPIHAGEGSPLLGLALLQGNVFTFPVRSGSTVTIVPLA